MRRQSASTDTVFVGLAISSSRGARVDALDRFFMLCVRDDSLIEYLVAGGYYPHV